MAEPGRIPHHRVVSALQAMGIDPARLVQVVIGSDSVTVVRERRDERGDKIAYSSGPSKHKDAIANVTTVIGVTRRGEDEQL